uniref:Ig-like domain-containing protein n=1 Tax=Chelonoidis abingdonii TaxID=106734 RepID=A0A8C0IRS8_CHEAB
REPSPVLHHPPREIVFPNIQPRPLPLQLETIAPCSVIWVDVTIRCQGQRWDVRFFWHKAGDLNLQRHMEPAGAGAKFDIPGVGRQHGGSYSCSYRPRSEPFISSQPSDTVELVVAGREYPKPTIWVSPSRVVALGGTVTVQCCGQNQGLQFMLNKEGRYVQSVNSDFLALFHINNVRQEHGGSYSCSYHSQSEPSAMSDPSDLMELVVRGEGPSSVSPFPAPPPARSSRGLGANRTLRARLSPGREVLPLQGWRPEPTATHGPCCECGGVPHPHRGPAARRELQLQLPAPVTALHLLRAQ